jgi:hypothetical protein
MSQALNTEVSKRTGYKEIASIARACTMEKGGRGSDFVHAMVPNPTSEDIPVLLTFFTSAL